MADKQSPETILDEALELSDSPERAAYLDKACGDDAALREEVESLLEAHLAADRFMETQAEPAWREVLDEKGAGDLNADSTPSIEELKDDFPELEIVELIGRGGMGAVFKARQASLDRFVALKVLPCEWSTSGSFAERFEREAKTLAALNHPNIVTIHEFGERNGRFFFTMEFVDGTDLARMIQSGEMKPELALSLIPQICEAIQFAHDGGVVHRDIKPANILVGRDGRVKVVDFGIAKLGNLKIDQEADANPASHPDLTAPRGVLGTPRYMAPEQASGSSEVDHRADLYALGVVFYEMLVGEPPARGELVIPPSRQGEVDRRWDKVVLHALEEDPERRYQNATEIKTAVESVLAEQKRLVPGWMKAVAVLALGSVAAGSILMWPRGDAEKEGPLVNSLGMQFVPVPGVEGLVSVWETRVKDYELFAKQTGRTWKPPSFEQTPDHPVVNVSWHDALAFCQWLTEHERDAGRLKEGEVYRLPTDREWSALAHLADEKGADPQERHQGQLTVYPWGEEAPVPVGAGNFPDLTGRDRLGSAAVTGYEDGFAATAPVGSFSPTKEGLYDLGGNVWEWTSTPFSTDDGRPVMRGGGWWASEADDGWRSLLASHRRANVEATEPDEWDVGFRVVRGPEAAEEDADDLFRLVLKGDLEGVSEALADGTDVNAGNRAGQPPIVLAADSGNFEMVKLLHESGAKLNRSDRRGRTPLHAAAEFGHTEMAGWLLAQGADARARTIAGQEPLLLAVRRAPLELLDQLLTAATQEALTQTDSHAVDPLAQACFSSPDETVRWVIEQLSVDQVREASASWIEGGTMWLADRDSSLMSAFLAKATGSLTPDALETALFLAICYDHEENFSLLLEAFGEDVPDDEILKFAGRVAVAAGRPWAIKALVGKGWDLKEHDNTNGDSLLHGAVVTGAELRRILRSLAAQSRVMQSDELRRLFERWLAKMPPPATRETIRLLAEGGANIDARDDTERTPLVAAAFEGNFDAVETLLELGAGIEAKDDLGFTSLLCAVKQGHLEIVKELDRWGANLRAVTKDGDGVLHVVHRHDEVLRYLMGKDLPLEAKNKEGATPLVHLASEGDEGVISLLLEAGADVHAAAGTGGRGGDTALHRACRAMTDKEKAERLQEVETRTRLGGPDEDDLVQPADKDERVRAIRLLLEQGADLNARNAILEMPLHLAARSGLPEVVELFLKRGAFPNAVTKLLEGPLHFAAGAGQLECVRVLLAHGAVTVTPTYRAPLVTHALQGENPEVLRLLLEHKAPLDIRNASGAFPLYLAAYHGQTEMVEVLLKAGADPDGRDLQYRTPLHAAAEYGHREVIDLLWNHGARMDAHDSANDTPAQLAARAGHRALAAHIGSLAKQPVERPERVAPEASSKQ